MRLGKALKLLRAEEAIGLREMAGRIGISAPTLSRLERDLPCDSGVFGKVLAYLLASNSTPSSRDQESDEAAHG